MEVIALFGEDGRSVCERCEVAAGPLTQARGLLGRSGLADDAGMLFRRCSSIHTCFMRFPIDAVFLDRDLRVLDVVGGLRPWRAAFRRRAYAVLELSGGAAARRRIRTGERLAWATALHAAA